MGPKTQVLVVSRSAFEREQIASLLTGSKAQIAFAETAADAWVHLAHNAAFDVILLGFDSPHEGHCRLVKAVLQNSPDTSIVLMSTIDDVDFYLRCLEIGAFDYLPRPIDWSEFKRIYQLALICRCGAPSPEAQAA